VQPRSLVVVAVSLGLLVLACGWNPSRPFDRESPEVRSAIKSLADGGDATVAAKGLEDYLSTGPCADGNIGTPELLKKRADGTFDLGLSLFKLGEAYGRRFGDEEQDSGPAEVKGLRGAEVGCALRILGQIAHDESVPLDLRARARYLEGNLDFLDGKYEEAVHAYDEALTLAPGSDAGDPVGRDAAWNRAIALDREENKKKDAGHDASTPDASHDASHDSGGQDSGHDGGQDGSSGPKDSGESSHDSGGQDSGKPDAGQPPPPKGQDAAPPPPPRANEDERMLDQLENAPTVQQEAAKKLAARHKVRGMADK
jgi:tetratricopeptide (TPR) repeat protein